jgi:glycosyltransferase involved in cell wall biosynthesis
VLQHLHLLYPDAPVYTSVYDWRKLPAEFATWDIRTTALQRLPAVRSYSRAMLPLMPWAFRRLDLAAFDVVITTSSAFSKNVATPPSAANLCYCHTPPRYLWELSREYLGGGAAQRALDPLVRWLRQRDIEAAGRVDLFIANSRNVARRIRDAYGRAATVVYPPVDTDRVQPNGRPSEDFYLVVSRLVPYKRVDLAIAACNRLRRRLIVVGAGPALPRLRVTAGPTIEFAGALPDGDVADLYARCRAFLFPANEDFGITAVEAQAAGRPVIAYAAGGALETVRDGITGIHFGEQSVDCLVDAIERFEHLSFDRAACRSNAEIFAAPVFRERIASLVAEYGTRG